jgi:DNA-binding winged helix-turn-helix (wHTH) protein
MKVAFGDVRLDSGTRQLWRAQSEEIQLTRKAFDLLVLLLERRPNVVSKEDIHARLWPDAFVSEANLQSLMSEIRDAIGDDARHSSLIRTVRGVGYAFCGTAADWEMAPSSHAPHVRAWLVGELGRLPLFDGDNVLGRTGVDVIELDSSTVSRRHALIKVGELATIDDLGSKNGTYVEEQRVTGPVRLADGNRIRVGSFMLTFRVVAATISTETQSES